MNYLYVILLCLSLLGCEPKEILVSLRSAGSSDYQYYSITQMSIMDQKGRGASFAYGATSGTTGKMADGPLVGAPKQIEGVWQKENKTQNRFGYRGFSDFYRIQAAIDPELAAEKMQVLHQYYYDSEIDDEGRFVLMVEGPRVRLFYTLGCCSSDFTPHEEKDPNGWVVDSPSGSKKVVVIFDGIGESSKTPFPNTRAAETLARCKKEPEQKKCSGWRALINQKE